MGLEYIFIILGTALIFLVFVLLWSVKSANIKIENLQKDKSGNQAISLMQQQMGQLTASVTQQLQTMNSQFQKTTGHIGSTLGDVKKDVGKMESVTREVLEKAKNISNLENLLRAPKFRGGLGELFLGDLLSQILPPAHYKLQYRFKSGEAVDAIVRIGGSIVPIDSKFPLENFKRYLTEEEEKDKNDLRKRFLADVKKHVDGIASKYILPDEGTYDFALMYIPAENIYYETILRDENFCDERAVFSYAIQKRVIPVSPNSFFAYLQVIVLGLKGLQIEKSARDIFQSLRRLHGDLERFRREFQVLGTHLINAKSKYDEADKRLDKFSGKLELIGGEKAEKLPAAEEDEEDS